MTPIKDKKLKMIMKNKKKEVTRDKEIINTIKSQEVDTTKVTNRNIRIVLLLKDMWKNEDTIKRITTMADRMTIIIGKSLIINLKEEVRITGNGSRIKIAIIRTKNIIM